MSLVRFLQPSGFAKHAVPSRWMYGNRLATFANPGTWSHQMHGVQKSSAVVGAAYAGATTDTSPVTGAEVAANPANALLTTGCHVTDARGQHASAPVTGHAYGRALTTVGSRLEWRG